MSNIINVQTGHLVPQRTQPRKWRTIANALDPPKTIAKKTPYMVVGPAGIENQSEVIAANMFADKNTKPDPTNAIIEVKGGLGDILLELFTPQDRPSNPIKPFQANTQQLVHTISNYDQKINLLNTSTQLMPTLLISSES